MTLKTRHIGKKTNPACCYPHDAPTSYPRWKYVRFSIEGNRDSEYGVVGFRQEDLR
jgi:hypothetical protein